MHVKGRPCSAPTSKWIPRPSARMTSCFVSVFFHLIILIIIVWHVDTLHYAVPTHYKRTMLAQLLIHPAPQHQKATPMSKQGVTHIRKNAVHHVQPRVQHTQNIQATQFNALIAYLYKEISIHQHYPAKARKLQETGTVTVSFMLAPSGVLTGLKVLHSSGYASLDSAALHTLQAAAPFGQAGKYIHKPEQFSLPVGYQLSA